MTRKRRRQSKPKEISTSEEKIDVQHARETAVDAEVLPDDAQDKLDAQEDTNPERKKPQGVLVLRVLSGGDIHIESDVSRYDWMHYMLNKAVNKLHQLEQFQNQRQAVARRNDSSNG